MQFRLARKRRALHGQSLLRKYIATTIEEHSIQIGLLCYSMTALVVLCYVAVAVVVAVVVMMIENCAC